MRLDNVNIRVEKVVRSHYILQWILTIWVLVIEQRQRGVGGGGGHWANYGLTENYMGIGRDKHC